MDPIQFIQQLEIAEAPAGLSPLAGGGYQSGTAHVDQEQAFVNERSLVSFVSGVSLTYRQDVLDSTLLAALAAEKKYPKNSNPKEWYNTFVEVLLNLGWIKMRDEEKSYVSSDREFDVDKAIIEIMTTVVGGPVTQVLLIEKTLSALKDLADDDGKVRLFEARAKNLNTSNFQIGMVTEENASVALNVSNFVFQNDQGSKKILFFRWGKDRAELSYRFFQATFNSAQYGDIRSVVKQKLGSRPETFVSELEI